MAGPKTEEYIFYQGERFQVEFYFAKDGRLPVKEYLEKVPLSVKIKLAALVKYIAEAGKIFDITKFRIIDYKERIYEFKPLSHRFFNFFYKGKKIIITNAYMKKAQKVDKKELQKARNIKRDYERRERDGVYYEKEKN